MNRETIFAIIFGIVLGVGVGVFVLFQTNKGDKAKVIPVTQEKSNKPVTTVPTVSEQKVLKISTPENNMVVKEKEIAIKGTAPKGSLVVMQSPVHSEVVKTDSENFSVPFTLAPGENIINISSYFESSSPQEVTLQIYYVKE